MQEKRWVYRNEEYDKNAIIETAEKLSVSPVLLTLLYNRGIYNPDEMRTFMSKSLKLVHDPLGLPDMDKAAERIYKAVTNNEKIYIYGDYDVDGITSTAIIYKYLLSHGADVSYYIPDRVEEGYGMNILAINKISKTGCKLIITVDCGVTSVGEIELAKAQGMDVIVTDHHTCKEKLPAATAVVNAKRHDSQYPFTELAGAGVALKTVLALSAHFGESAKDVFYKYVMLAAIGTVADVVPLVDENRTIVDRGVSELTMTDSKGIKSLLRVAGVKEVTSGSIAFAIAPRINAAGRVDNASVAVELLLCEDRNRADELADILNVDNNHRRAEEKRIYDEAVALAEKDPDIKNKKVIVLAGEAWHHGVIGIVASRICEKYYKPTVILSHENGIAKGSCRSIDGFNMFDALTECDDLLDKFGGHALAAGLALKTENIEAFSEKINKYGKDVMGDTNPVPEIRIDCRVSPSTLTIDKIKMLSSMEPFGQGNEEPIFSIDRAKILTSMQIGEEKNHLRLQIQKGECVLSCIAFRMGEYIDELSPGSLIDVAFTPEINTYNGRRSVQLRVRDIKKSKKTERM